MGTEHGSGSLYPCVLGSIRFFREASRSAFAMSLLSSESAPGASSVDVLGGSGSRVSSWADFFRVGSGDGDSRGHLDDLCACCTPPGAARPSPNWSKMSPESAAEAAFAALPTTPTIALAGKVLVKISTTNFRRSVPASLTSPWSIRGPLGERVGQSEDGVPQS
jgi:hypothetical protein